VRKLHIYFGGKRRVHLNCLSPHTNAAEGKAADAAAEKAAEEEMAAAQAAEALEVAAVTAAAAAAKMGILSDTEGNFVKAKIPGRRRRRSMTMEFHAEKDEDIMHALQDLYDPKRQAVGHELYTLQNLLKRESVQWDTRVRKVLDAIWKAIDIDGSGGISKDEYDAMHEQMWFAVHELDKIKDGKGTKPRKPSLIKKNESAAEKKARQTKHLDAAEAREVEDREMRERQLESLQDDWDSDCQGHKHLNYQRFTQCWFVMADRFTHTVDAGEYAQFLEKVQQMMADYRARHPEKYHPDYHATANNKLYDDGDENNKKRTNFIVKKFKSAVKAVIHRVSDWGLNSSNIRWGDRVLCQKCARGGQDAGCGPEEAVVGYVCAIIKIDNPAYTHGSLTMPEGTKRYLFEYNVRCSDGVEATNIKPEFLKVMGINDASPSPGMPRRVMGGAAGGKGGADCLTPEQANEQRRRIKEERLKNIAARREAARRASGDWHDQLRGGGGGMNWGKGAGAKPNAVGPGGRRGSREAFAENIDPAELGVRRNSGLKDAAGAAMAGNMMRRASQNRKANDERNRRVSAGGVGTVQPRNRSISDPSANRLSQPRNVVKKVVGRGPVYVLDAPSTAQVATPILIGQVQAAKGRSESDHRPNAAAAPILIGKAGSSSPLIAARKGNTSPSMKPIPLQGRRPRSYSQGVIPGDNLALISNARSPVENSSSGLIASPRLETASAGYLRKPPRRSSYNGRPSNMVNKPTAIQKASFGGLLALEGKGQDKMGLLPPLNAKQMS
jgi:hypothetical protein